MTIAAWLSARTEPREMRDSGFELWAAFLRIDGVLSWSDLRCLGIRRTGISFAYAQHQGTLVVLRKLAALSEANPEAGIRFETDSRIVIEELKGDAVQRDPRCEPLVEESRGLVRRMEPVLTMRYCHVGDIAIAQEMISLWCKKNRVEI